MSKRFFNADILKNDRSFFTMTIKVFRNISYLKPSNHVHVYIYIVHVYNLVGECIADSYLFDLGFVMDSDTPYVNTEDIPSLILKY